MLDIIKNILLEEKADAFRITQYRTESSEMFFVGRNLDMLRAKNVCHYKMTVYNDFMEDGKRYRGSCDSDIHPTMKPDEIRQAVKNAIFAAGFVKNPYYPLAEPGDYKGVPKSRFAEGVLTDHLDKLAAEIFVNDNHTNGRICSAELFLEKKYRRLINSQGVDATEETYECMIEFIIGWKGDTEETELYKSLRFSDYEDNQVSAAVADRMEACRKKASAERIAEIGECSFLLTGEDVSSFFEYFRAKSNASAVYNGESDWKPGKKIQPASKGDWISIMLDPNLEHAVHSSGFDHDGYPLRPVRIIEEGVLNRYAADVRYACYTNSVPTGTIRNLKVDRGSRTIAEMKSDPYLEILAFSDFTMDTITGDFGGEIRLAQYFDGEKLRSLTGGSVTGNIERVLDEIYLSNEICRLDHYEGPKFISMKNLKYTGA